MQLMRWLVGRSSNVVCASAVVCLLLYLGGGRQTTTPGYTTGPPRSQLRQQPESVAREAEESLTEETWVGASQEDPALVSYIRRYLLASPSTQSYNLTNPEREDFSESGQSLYVDQRVLHGMRGGFFVEVGAVDGEFFSNTLFLERRRQWSGLLIEANPDTYTTLLHKHRKAYSVNAALALTNTTSVVNYVAKGGLGILGQVIPDSHQGVKVKAVPLYAMLKAVNITIIDFFSLDVEGVEMEVLRTIPWDKIKVRLMCVEINKIRGGVKTLNAFLLDKGYQFLASGKVDAWYGWPDLLRQTKKDN